MKNWRINLILIFIFLFGGVLAGKLFFIQIVQQKHWKSLALGQHKFFNPVQGERGEIFLQDREGKLYTLASNKNLSYATISPSEIRKKPEKINKIAEILSKTLSLERDFILEKIKSENMLEVIKNKLTMEEEKAFSEIKFSGVSLRTETLRYYPQETLASQVVGFVSKDQGGQYGLEEYYNDALSGSQGFEEGERGKSGLLLWLDSRGAERGSNLILTLDYNIQFTAEKLLKKASEDLKIEGGQIIVVDPHSGKIFALANFPNFNPNEYSQENDLAIFQNSAIQKIYEPGSVFKPITMAAALDQEKITPQTEYVDEGIVKVGNQFVKNYDNRIWGKRTMTEVLERSINTGAVFAERQAGNESFLNYVQRFGFFEPTKIDLEGEIYSSNAHLQNGREINFTTAAFGQGVEVTPIQLVRAFSAIANGGELVKPFVVEKTVNNKQTTESQPKASNDAVISVQTVSQLTGMLVSVIENGFSKKARIPGYYIAGKTGTAQVPWTSLGINKAGYSDKTWQTFIGFAPAFSAKFVVFVKLDNPQASTAEYSAMPIFHELTKYLINYWQIPPDYETQ